MASINDNDAGDDTTAYRIKIIRGVLDAVVKAGAIEGSGGGMVNIAVALEGLCDAIAALENAAGVSKNAGERHETADVCRRRIIETGSALARAAANGQPLPWHFEAMGRLS